MAKQTLNGKAFEYAFLRSMNEILSQGQYVRILESKPLITANDAFDSLDLKNQERMKVAANAGIKTLLKLEPKLLSGNDILDLTIQADAKGKLGDVRDVVAIRSEDNWEVGVSCKNNHAALKHSRLSGTINIGKDWFQLNSSNEYFNEVCPIFDELKEIGKRGTYWRDLSGKADRYYVPILKAFIKELQLLEDQNPEIVPQRLLSYLLGRNDFYKAIAYEKNKTTEIQGFNLYGSLNRKSKNVDPQVKISKLHLPNKFYDIHFKNNSKNTVLIVCDQGWTVSCRIHNASEVVENSLKFDVQLVGLPPSLYKHTESWYE